MNILYLCDEYPPGRHGGIGTAVQLLARQMARDGHNVIVAGFYDLGYGGADSFTDEGVMVYRFRRKMDTTFFADKESLKVRLAYRILQKTGFFQKDIAHSLKQYHTFLESLIALHHIEIVEMPDFNEYMRFCTAYTLFPKLSVPTIVKLHGSATYFLKEMGEDVSEILYHMEQSLLQQADAVVSVSSYTAIQTSMYFTYTKEIVVLQNGIDTGDIPVATGKEPKQVIYTGTLVEKKGIYQLLKAWNIVHDKMPTATLWVCGKGDIRKAISIISSDAVKSVFFKGHVPRTGLLAYLAVSMVAVFPSYAETFGLGAVEAMACGTAVINSSRTSGPEIVMDNVTGLLVDPDSPKEIADKILYLLQNQETCNHLAMSGARYAREYFDIKTIATKHFAFYQRLLDKPHTYPNTR